MRDRFYIVLLISCILHILFALFIELIPKQGSVLQQSFISQNPQRHGIIIVKKPEKEKNLKNKQIVDLPTKAKKEKLDNSKYYSEEDRKTDRETIKRGVPTIEKEKEKKQKGINLFPGNIIDDIAKNRVSEQNGNNGTNDSIDAEEGEETSLNTIEFKYASFFNRVKREIAANWNPLDILKSQDPTGKLYMFKARKTILLVTLDKEGYIIKISVTQSSNVDFLDEEAINSLKRCIQFVNPPKGLIKNGKIEFYFGYVVSYSFRGRIFY